MDTCTDELGRRFDATARDPAWYRHRVAAGVFRHLLGCFNVAVRDFDAHVPRSDRGHDFVHWYDASTQGEP